MFFSVHYKNETEIKDFLMWNTKGDKSKSFASGIQLCEYHFREKHNQTKKIICDHELEEIFHFNIYNEY
jgi:hypothetical protein